MSLIKQLEEVEKRVADACKKANRNRDEVTLVAVSKTKPIAMIEELLPTGIVDFGENKVQDLTVKYEALPKNLQWHMIGHLQRNKVKYIIDKVSLIHSVDSFRLAKMIEEEAAKANRVVSILIEVNIAKEESKFGVFPEDTIDIIEKIAPFPHISICGLMTSAPYVTNPEENRIVFRTLRKLSLDIQAKNINNVTMTVLSMGMTGDYEVAIEEGATMIRVGTGIFGERNYFI